MTSLFLLSCKNNAQELRKLSPEDVLYRARIGKYYDPESLLYKDTIGHIMDYQTIITLNRDSLAMDEYVDKTDSVKVGIVRKITSTDILLRQEIAKLLSDNIELQINYIKATVKDSTMRAIEYAMYAAPITPIPINCDSTKILLSKILISDQKGRSENTIDLKKDRENQIKVVSIIENCGFPRYNTVGEDGMNAVFLVIQHSHRELMEKYFPLLKESAEKGELSKADIALMEDRILINNEKKQKYGSQVKFNAKANMYELLPIENPIVVNKLRSDIGLEPLEIYLTRFGIKWNPISFKIENNYK